jgi:hypothetical protein
MLHPLVVPGDASCLTPPPSWQWHHLAVTPLLATWLHCLQPDVGLMLILEGDLLEGS